MIPGRVLLLLLCHAACCDAAAVASGRNWQLAILGTQCQAGESLLVVGAHIRFLGPRGPAEAPLSRLLDGEGRRYPPKTLVWRAGPGAHAAWLSSGGLANLQSRDIGELQWKFDVRGARGGLSLEFGDIAAFALTRRGSPACAGLLALDEIRPPRASRAARVENSGDVAVHRARYPCGPPAQVIAADYPPYLPRQLLLFGRGFLPAAREIELPMGSAGAQPYTYAGTGELASVEDAARRAAAADFPQYAARSKYFAFNWGVQQAAGGNEAYAVGLYELRPCPK